MLLDKEILKYTDHKYLTYTSLNCHHMLCLQLLVEEYGLTILYHPGEFHAIVDAFNQLK